MSEEFVIKDVYDVEIRRIDEKIDATVNRIESKLEASLAEIKAQNASFREHVSNELSDMRADMKKMDGRMSALEAKVDNISRNVGLIMTLFGLAISAVTIIAQFLR